MSEKKLPDDSGLNAARRYAGWELGDPSWAYSIIDAYLNPKEANDRMDAKDIPARTGTYRSQW